MHKMALCDSLQSWRLFFLSLKAKKTAFNRSVGQTEFVRRKVTGCIQSFRCLVNTVSECFRPETAQSTRVLEQTPAAIQVSSWGHSLQSFLKGLPWATLVSLNCCGPIDVVTWISMPLDNCFEIKWPQQGMHKNWQICSWQQFVSW